MFAEVKKDESYILSTGKVGQKSLALQQKYLSKISLDLLKKANIQPGMVAYDIGCGAGSMTVHLAKQVGPSGCVIAVDASAEQLEATRNAVRQAGLNNVKFIQADILQFESLPKQPGDVVYSRFVLMHLPNPQCALENMYSLLKEGGVLALQEPTWSTVNTNYPDSFLHEYRDAVIQLGNAKGLDYNIGRKLPKMSLSLQDSFVESYESVRKITLAEYTPLAQLRFQELGAKLIAAGVINTKTLQKWRKALGSMPMKDPRYFVNLGNLTCVLVKKGRSR